MDKLHGKKVHVFYTANQSSMKMMTSDTKNVTVRCLEVFLNDF